MTHARSFWRIVLVLIASTMLLSTRSLHSTESAPSHETQIKAACVPNSTALCLKNDRFKVTARWRTPDGQSGAGQAVRLSPDTGYFWFFNAANVEFVLKVIDGCSFSRRFWVFAGGLTNLQVDITVEDTATGVRKTYRNAQNTAFQPIQDTDAFGNCSIRRSGAVESVTTPEEAWSSLANEMALASAQTAAPTKSEEALLLHQDRFRVTANWRRPSGETGSAQAVRLTNETGYFWFFDQNNVEMILKILDGCSLSDRFWVFAGGLTNLRVDITVEDLSTGVSKTYRNPQNTAFAPIQDTGALASCSGGLPPDPGAAGRQSLEGIDSDRDGVRDDIQRHIHLTYPGQDTTIEALEQTAKTLQATLLDAGSPQRSVDHATQMVRNFECLAAIRPADAGQVRRSLLAAALNTEQRGLAHLRYNDQLGGEAFPLKDPAEWQTSCEFTVSATADGQPLPDLENKALCGESKEATVFFVNGVFNDCDDASDSLSALSAAANGFLAPEDVENIEFALACNPSHGKIADLWVAVKQRLENDYGRFYRYLSNLEPMPDFMQDAYSFAASTLDVAALLTSPTTRRHIDLYKREVLEGRKVVLVAHSQGNFYANRAWFELSSTEQVSVGIVSVANPDTRVADGRPYTTLTNDIIIRPIPFALRANTSNGGFTLRDVTGHRFTDSYLAAGSNSRTQILNHLQDALETLESPDAGAGDGIITVTLTWGSQPDVDLHVFEPDGTHVFYASRGGNAGFLDVDDVTGFGPEHYFASCSSLVPGFYRVGVNYFAGFAPETATIQIQAGLLLRSYQVVLTDVRGSSGDSNPIPVANIIVTGNISEGFEFQVQ